jgi:putative flavoprotein involved in K+ transport
MRELLGKIDRHVGEAPGAERVPPLALPSGPNSLDLDANRIATVIWATGYRRAYPWLHVPAVGPDGELVHRRGVTPVPGLYALGLRWQHRRSSHMIAGVGRDAAFLAERLVAPAVSPAAARSRPRRPALVPALA